MQVSIGDIVTARRRIADCVSETPLLADDGLGGALFKLECWQRTGSFKVRGAFNRLKALSPAERAQGVIAASSGNHAQGVALAARTLGIDALLVMSDQVPPVKVAAVRRLGAQVVLRGRDFDDAVAGADALCAETGRTMVHAFADSFCIAGQGTVGLEIAAAAPETALVAVPAGGGGLAVGCAVALKALLPTVRVVGVQSEASTHLATSFRAGRPVPVRHLPTIAEGLYGDTTPEMVDLALRHLDDVIVVSEEAIADALRYLFHAHRIVAEGSGAVAVAALREGLLPLRATVAIVSGRNVEPELFRRLVLDPKA